MQTIKRPNKILHKPVLVQCSWCIFPQVLTTNGKCKKCGSKLVKQKHWDRASKTIELINQYKKKGIPLQIKEKLYFVPSEYFEEYESIAHMGFKEKVMIIEHIRKECVGFDL